MSKGGAVDLTPLSGHIGAELSEMDLRDPSDDDVARIRAALNDHHVVFLRGQVLSDDEHYALAARFGRVTTESSATNGARFQMVVDAEDNPPHTDQWHTDMTCWEEPPSLALLCARIIPVVGGDTIWVSLCAIHDALSSTMRSFVEGLHVRHYVGPQFRDAVALNIASNTGGAMTAIRSGLDERYAETYAVHPLVRTHPITHRPALFLSPRFEHSIEELHPEEGAALLAHLHTYLDDPNFQVRWRWQVNDIAIWDEATTNHRALADHFYPKAQNRLMRRCTVAGDRPFFKKVPA
jgi:taurine dioxygenase